MHRLFTIIYMFKDNVKNYILPPAILSQLNILLLYNFTSYDFELNYYNYLISSTIFFLLFIIIIHAFRFNKLIGIILFLSTFFLTPIFRNETTGQLFPITVIIFLSYFLYRFGLKIYENWKKSMEL